MAGSRAADRDKRGLAPTRGAHNHRRRHGRTTRSTLQPKVRGHAPLYRTPDTAQRNQHSRQPRTAINRCSTIECRGPPARAKLDGTGIIPIVAAQTAVRNAQLTAHHAMTTVGVRMMRASWPNRSPCSRGNHSNSPRGSDAGRRSPCAARWPVLGIANAAST